MTTDEIVKLIEQFIHKTSPHIPPPLDLDDLRQELFIIAITRDLSDVKHPRAFLWRCFFYRMQNIRVLLERRKTEPIEEHPVCDDIINRLRAAVQSLPKEEFHVVYEYFLCKQTLEEVQEALNLTERKVRKLKSSALERLRGILC